MTNTNDSIHNSEQAPQDGLTKLEYFASMAMQGLLTQHVKFRKQDAHNREYVSEPVYKGEYIDVDPVYSPIAMDAVSIAKALIAELNKE